METERPHRTTTSTSSNSSTSELFVCFTSRMSSSSMKLSSKSLLSPSRSRDPTTPQISLSSSLSRRLRSNGSMKGGQASPMFPTTVGKRRGGGFENPEPSSPKVTCIGQVRVKTKKQGKKMRARSKRRSEASFRKTAAEGGGGVSSDLTRQNSSTSFQYQNSHQGLQQGGGCLKHRNQRWVHLPLTICEALREFNCFFPCRSSCMRREKEEKGVGEGSRHGYHHGGDGREGSCGAAFARWLHVALQEGGGGDGKGREIEVVMGEEEDDGDGDGGREGNYGGRSYRRHVFEDIDIDVVEGVKENEERFLGEGEGEEGEEKARVSICIPPKNALLLMRCRSDPVKMAALANRFWESPVHNKDQVDNEGEDEVEEEKEEEENGDADVEEEQHQEEEQEQVEMEEEKEVQRETEEEGNNICEREEESEGFVNSEEQHHADVVSSTEKTEETEVLENLETESRTSPESNEAQEANQVTEESETAEEEREEGEDELGNNNNLQDETLSCVSDLEARSDLQEPETQEAHLQEAEEENQNDESSELSSTPETLAASEPQNDEEPAKTTTSTMAEEASAEEGLIEEEQQLEQNETTDTPPPPPPPEVTPPTHEGLDPSNEPGSEERENGSNGEERERRRDTLPECLLLMMCEPKLSMEVSKETWVCSTDFVRWLPERPAGKITGGRGAAVGRNGVDKKQLTAAVAPPPQIQPPRSSCSFPAAAGMSMAAMIEQRLAAGPKSNGYEPFVLTRCKSEPMRSTAKLAADTCFWKKPHAPPATLGVGATAGVGF